MIKFVNGEENTLLSQMKLDTSQPTLQKLTIYSDNPTPTMAKISNFDEEIIIIGKRSNEESTYKVVSSRSGLNKFERKFKVPAKIGPFDVTMEEIKKNNHLERLWTYYRLREILESSSPEATESPELNEVLRAAKAWSFITNMTAYYLTTENVEGSEDPLDTFGLAEKFAALDSYGIK